MKTPIVMLGQPGTTFSSDAYGKLAEMFNTPSLQSGEIMSVEKNEDVLPALLKYPDGYGVLAMETKAGGRVNEPLESFIDLLSLGMNACSFHIIGAIRMRIHFALMARSGVKLESIRNILAHPKAFGPCKRRISAIGLSVTEADNNGKAAEDVASLEKYEDFAVLGPESAAKAFGLDVIDETFEDGEAFTTFFLLAPKIVSLFQEKMNRALIVFRLKHVSGSLVDSLIPFKEEGLSLIQIHSVHVENGNYSFAIELDCLDSQLQAFNRAATKFQKHVVSSIVFGPFEVREG